MSRPGAQAEDDGFLLSLVTHDETLRSECWVFDARNIETGPLARVSLPQRVPSGFHATWIREDRLKPTA